VVASDTTELEKTLRQFAWLLAGVCGGTILAATVSLALVVWHGLRPLGRLADHIHAIDSNSICRRVELKSCPSEMRPVVQRLNELLEKVEDAIQRERAFTSDVAHELRTPLAALSAALEVCGGQARSAATYEGIVRDCLGVTRTMRVMVENLLMLARTDAHQIQPSYERIDVTVILREIWKAFQAASEARGLQVAWTLDPDLVTDSDPALLRIIVRNLIDNAVSYCDASGRVHISCRWMRDVLALRVSNTGSRVAPEDAGRVCDRFWRGDAARSDDGRHCGLGLALCRRVTELLGGTLQPEATAGGEFIVTLTLPRKERHERDAGQPLEAAA
jgi:two-component system heavy metal sensor histidine kinase CusS